MDGRINNIQSISIDLKESQSCLNHKIDNLDSKFTDLEAKNATRHIDFSRNLNMISDKPDYLRIDVNGLTVKTVKTDTNIIQFEKLLKEKKKKQG